MDGDLRQQGHCHLRILGVFFTLNSMMIPWIKQCVMVNSIISDAKETTCGVNQCSSLTLLLDLFYNNDMELSWEVSSFNTEMTASLLSQIAIKTLFLTIVSLIYNPVISGLLKTNIQCTLVKLNVLFLDLDANQTK